MAQLRGLRIHILRDVISYYLSDEYNSSSGLKIQDLDDPITPHLQVLQLLRFCVPYPQESKS